MKRLHSKRQWLISQYWFLLGPLNHPTHESVWQAITGFIKIENIFLIFWDSECELCVGFCLSLNVRSLIIYLRLSQSVQE